MNIKILGPGCSRCHTLSRMAREVIEELGMVVLQEFDLLEEFRRYGPLVMDKERLTSLGRGLKEEIKAYKILDKKFTIEVEDAITYIRHMEVRNAKARILSRIPEQLREGLWSGIGHQMILVYGAKEVPMTLHGLALVIQK